MKNKIIAALLLIFCSAFSWNYFQSKQPSNKSQTANTKPQTSRESYEALWNRVDSLQKKGLRKSALSVVMEIYKKAKAENNPPELVKAVIHRIKFQNSTEEDAMKKNIADLNKEISEATPTVKPLLHSMLAEAYWNFYQQNRSRFLERTETVNFKNEDISTWDLRKILAETIRQYKLSLVDKEHSEKVQVNIFDEVLIKGTTPEARKFRPTLFDFLAHRAIDFYMNEESGLALPSNSFEMSNPYLLGDADNFISVRLNSNDSFNLKYNALQVFKELLEFHRTDAHPAALIDADLKRINFVHSQSTIEKKDSLYLLALQHLADRYKEYPGSIDAMYDMASYYNSKGDESKDKGSENKWMKRRAEQICDSAMTAFPYSQGGVNCKYLKSIIEQKNLDFNVAQVNVSNRPFLAKINYKNINKVFLRVAKNDKPDSVYEGLYGDQLVRAYLNLPVVKEWNVNLEDDGDKLNHSVEIKIPELPLGKYIVLASNNEAFSYEKNTVAYSGTWVSDISFTNRRLDNGSYDLYVFNRSSGAVLKNVRVTVYSYEYNSNKRKYEQRPGANFTTNDDGYISIPSSDNYRNYDIEFVNGNDRLYFKSSLYGFRTETRKVKRLQTFFFTDRSIYRPGQTVYFKGILLETDGDTSVIKPQQNTTVQFYDVNSQKLSELKLTTNEFGTFSGSFIALQGALTGQMRIQNESGSLYFSVEEYKRPKFEVNPEPTVGFYKLGELITITGKATSYSGATVSNAEVKYRVVRRARFPDWFYYWRGFTPSSPELEITNGTTTTDSNGIYKISFTAIPDKTISEESDPVFDFEISSDVTDINGETHSNSQVIALSYKSLFLETDLKENIDANVVKAFTIESRNISGLFEPTVGNISIHRIEPPQRLLRDRLWDRPDRTSMSKEEFERTFPNDIYKDENEIAKWKLVEEVYSGSFDTKKDSVIKLSQIATWKKGNYVVELKSKDRYGKDVKYLRYITLFSSKDKECPVNSFAWFNAIKEKGEPGERAQFLIGSKDKDVRVLYEVEWNNEIILKQWLTLNDEQRLIEIPIEEKYRGNFGVHFNFVKQNRFYHFDHAVAVPWTNKELEISIETFRDKLQPGSKEEWQLKIAGKNGDKVAAEMVASMYDASLDAFVPHNWNFNIYNTYSIKRSFQLGVGFASVNSSNFSKEWNVIFPPTYRRYDELNWFDAGWGDSYGGRRTYYSRGISSAMAAPSAGGLKGIQAEEKIMKKAGDEMESQQNEKSVQAAASEATAGVAMSPRVHFEETAFFYPHLTTNEKGEVIFSFTMPDALTRWKFLGFATTKDLKYGMIEKELVTQKELMIVPNAPRFFREGDSMNFAAKITNLSDGPLNITSAISFFDALTNQNITSKVLKGDSIIKSSVSKGQNIPVAWNLSIPEGIGAIKYRVAATSTRFSDAEEMAIPVLSNKILVTESLPLWANAGQTKTFKLDKLLTSANKSPTLRNYKLTLVYTSNPAWYAIQALPYLMEYPYDCSEQIFSKYYANAIASNVANSNPKIKAVFESWKTQSPQSFLSNLEKNQELKQGILEQTPWLLDAKDESERKKRVALLFDLNKMANELQSALLKLQKKQMTNGAWPWFDGMPDDRYITQYIVEGFAHLDHLGIKTVRNDDATWAMVKNAIQYCDARINEDYTNLNSLKIDLKKRQLSSIQIQYLYGRSVFKDVPVASECKKAFDYYLSQEKEYWLQNSEYMQGMIALTLFRNNDAAKANDILKSLKENSQYSEELGRYWKNNVGGFFWSQAPIETQALLIEAFHDINNDKRMVDEMQRWLLKNKQTNDWKTTKATAEACYALLLQGTDFLAESKLADVTVGNKVISPSNGTASAPEAGTGYFKTSWTGVEIKPEMGDVKVTNPNAVVSWGALYWQYFENMDKVTSAETPLKLLKKLFLEQVSGSGKTITPITDATELKVGDRIKVRIELRSDRDMEYVMMRDMRASGTEPENVLSQYKYQDGLGYYESTHDASTDFFFSYLAKGTYVFEYPLVVSQRGDFANGITNIQCMYAPEFASHSEGVRLKIK